MEHRCCGRSNVLSTGEALHEELQVHQCYASNGPMELAGRLLGVRTRRWSTGPRRPVKGMYSEQENVYYMYILRYPALNGLFHTNLRIH